MQNPVCHIQDKYHIPYFKHQELACSKTGIVKLAAGFADKLIELRTNLAKPMIVTSCCRSIKHNQQIGGNPNSFHIYDESPHKTNGTCAIDISITNSYSRGQLTTLAWNLGWSVGIAKNFVHLDRRIDHTHLKQALFLY